MRGFPRFYRRRRRSDGLLRWLWIDVHLDADADG
jgi:hypothetical protein